MGKFKMARIRRYLQGHSVNMDGIKIPYELHSDFKQCIEREQC